MPRWLQYPRRYRSPPFVSDNENGFQWRSRSLAPCDVRETVRLSVLNRSGPAGTHFDQPVGPCSRYRPYDLNSQIGSHDTVWVRWMLGRDRN